MKLLLILHIPFFLSCSLHIKYLKRLDAGGEYSCRILNEAGEGTSVQSYELDVYCKCAFRKDALCAFVYFSTTT